MGDAHVLRNGITQRQGRVAIEDPTVVGAFVGILGCAEVEDGHVAVNGNAAHGTPDLVAVGFDQDVDHLVLTIHRRCPRLFNIGEHAANGTGRVAIAVVGGTHPCLGEASAAVVVFANEAGH